MQNLKRDRQEPDYEDSVALEKLQSPAKSLKLEDTVADHNQSIRFSPDPKDEAHWIRKINKIFSKQDGSIINLDNGHLEETSKVRGGMGEGAAFTTLLDKLKNSPKCFEELRLRGQGISDTGARLLVDALKSNSTIESLFLGDAFKENNYADFSVSTYKNDKNVQYRRYIDEENVQMVDRIAMNYITDCGAKLFIELATDPKSISKMRDIEFETEMNKISENLEIPRVSQETANRINTILFEKAIFSERKSASDKIPADSEILKEILQNVEMLNKKVDKMENEIGDLKKQNSILVSCKHQKKAWFADEEVDSENEDQPAGEY